MNSRLTKVAGWKNMEKKKNVILSGCRTEEDNFSRQEQRKMAALTRQELKDLEGV